MFGNTKSPVALVTTGTLCVPRDSLINTTVAPGITPPVEFTTVTAMVPDVICAVSIGTGSHALISASRTARRILTCIYAWPPTTNPGAVVPPEPTQYRRFRRGTPPRATRSSGVTAHVFEVDKASPLPDALQPKYRLSGKFLYRTSA